MTVRHAKLPRQVDGTQLEVGNDFLEHHALTSHFARYSASGKVRTGVNDQAAVSSHNAPMGKSVTKKAANHLRAWREFRGLTQQELAERIDTANNVISLLESGDRKLSDKWLNKLAPALGTTPGFLLDHDPRDIDASFIDAAMAIPKDKRAQVLEILKTFRDAG